MSAPMYNSHLASSLVLLLLVASASSLQSRANSNSSSSGSINNGSAAAAAVRRNWQVVQVNVYARHGERDRLVIDELGQEVPAPLAAPLTDNGALQAFSVGQQLRARYIVEEAPYFIPALETYSSDEGIFYSTDYDRALSTGQALSFGLYPPLGLMACNGNGSKNTGTDGGGGGDVIISSSSDIHLTPLELKTVSVHTVDQSNDVTLRAWDKCPTFTKRILEMFSSTAFLTQQQSVEALMTSLKTELPSVGVCVAEVERLDNTEWFLLFDCLNTLRLADSDSFFSLVSHDLWNAVLQQTYALEDQKWSWPMVGRMIGGVWLARLVESIHLQIDYLDGGGSDGIGATASTMSKGSDISSTSSNSYANEKVEPHRTLRVFVGHYAGMKGVAAALNVSEALPGIPDFASVLIFELLYDVDTMDKGLRILYQDGSNGVLTTVPLPWGEVDEDGVINFAAFQSYLKVNGRLYTSDSEWCDECKNTSADICLRGIVSTLTEEQANCDTNSNPNMEGDDSPFKYFITCFAGMVAGVLVTSWIQKYSACCGGGGGGGGGGSRSRGGIGISMSGSTTVLERPSSTSTLEIKGAGLGGMGEGCGEEEDDDDDDEDTKEHYRNEASRRNSHDMTIRMIQQMNSNSTNSGGSSSGGGAYGGSLRVGSGTPISNGRPQLTVTGRSNGQGGSGVGGAPAPTYSVRGGQQQPGNTGGYLHQQQHLPQQHSAHQQRQQQQQQYQYDQYTQRYPPAPRPPLPVTRPVSADTGGGGRGGGSGGVDEQSSGRRRPSLSWADQRVQLV